MALLNLLEKKKYSNQVVHLGHLAFWNVKHTMCVHHEHFRKADLLIYLWEEVLHKTVWIIGKKKAQVVVNILREVAGSVDL